VGPGASCTRLVEAILRDRPHRARSVCVPGVGEVASLLRVLAMLATEGMPLKLDALYGAEPVEMPKPRRPLVVPVGSGPFILPQQKPTLDADAGGRARLLPSRVSPGRQEPRPPALQSPVLDPVLAQTVAM